MKNTVNIIYPILLAVTIAVIATGLAGNGKRHSSRFCRCVTVEMKGKDSVKFIDGKGVLALVGREYGGCVNRYCDSVNLDRIEKILMNTGMFASCDAYFTSDCILHLDVSQCTPLAKVTLNGQKHYLGENGKCIRIKEDWCRNIPSISGEMPYGNEKWLKGLAEVCIKAEEEWKGNIKKLKSNGKGDISIILKDSGEEFIIGWPVGIDEKFGRIRKYRSDVIPVIEEGKKYETVNVSYKGQVICR